MEIIENDIDIVEKVRKLMVKLRRPIMTAKLFQHTSLRARLSSDKKWTSIYCMLRCHAKLPDFVADLNNEDLDDYLLNISTERKVDLFPRNLTALNEVVMILKTNDCTIRQLRSYLHSVLEVYPTPEACLSNNARIVCSTHFESDIAKVQEQRKMNLTSFEKGH